jgi:hypothetical protein
MTTRFSLYAIISRLEGKTSERERYEKIKEHEAALIRLDYFGDFDFDTKGADHFKLVSQCYTNTLNTDLHIYYFRTEITFGDTTNIHIAARFEDIPKIQSIFNQLTNQNTRSPHLPK